jgi:hypothetical protein
LIVSAPAAVGVGEADYGRILGARPKITDAKLLGDVGQDRKLGVRHPQDGLGVKCALNLACLPLLLVHKLNIENIARELDKEAPLRLGATVDEFLLPIRLRMHGRALPVCLKFLHTRKGGTRITPGTIRTLGRDRESGW